MLPNLTLVKTSKDKQSLKLVVRTDFKAGTNFLAGTNFRDGLIFEAGTNFKDGTNQICIPTSKLGWYQRQSWHHNFYWNSS